MPRKCSLCVHENREEIDQLIIRGEVSYSVIAERNGTTKASLSRHKNHIEEHIVNAVNLEIREAQSKSIEKNIRTVMEILEEIDSLYAKTKKIHQIAFEGFKVPLPTNPGPYDWSEVEVLARDLARNRKEAITSIGHMVKILDHYAKFLSFSRESKDSEQAEIAPLPLSVQKMLKKMESGKA